MLGTRLCHWIATLPWIALSVCIELVSSSARGTSVRSQQGVVLTHSVTSGPQVYLSSINSNAYFCTLFVRISTPLSCNTHFKVRWAVICWQIQSTIFVFLVTGRFQDELCRLERTLALWSLPIHTGTKDRRVFLCTWQLFQPSHSFTTWLQSFW